MAATTIEPEVKDESIIYEVIREEDAEQVLKLLKNTFFKVKILEGRSISLPAFLLFSNVVNVSFRPNNQRTKGENRNNDSGAFHVFFAINVMTLLVSLHWSQNDKILDVPNNPSFAQQKKCGAEEKDFIQSQRGNEKVFFPIQLNFLLLYFVTKMPVRFKRG